MPRPDFTIRARLLLLALVVLLPALGLTAWFIAHDAQHARDAARARIDLLAAGTVDDLRRFLEHMRTELEGISERTTLRIPSPSSCDAFLDEFVRTNRDHAALAVRDARNRIVCVQPATPEARALAEAAPGSDAALKGDAFTVSDGVMLPGGNRWIVGLHQPIRGADGAAAGLITSIVDLRQLNNDLFGGVPASALVSVIDASRAVLLRSADAATYLGNRPEPGEPNPLAGMTQGFRVAKGRDGVVRLVALHAVPMTRWQVIAGQPEQAAMADAMHGLYQTTALLGTVLLFAAVVAWRISAGIVKPIQALTRTAAAIAAGDASARAALAGPPEVCAVARQVNEMLDARAFAEARLRGIIESAVDAVVTANADQVIVQANPAAAAMFRTTVEAMLGAPLERFIPMRHRAPHREAVQAFGAGTVTARHMGAAREVQALRADGSEFPIEASISHIMVNGQHLYTVIHRDVSERKRAEAALLEGKATLEAALASMNDAVFITDADGRIQQANDAFVRFVRAKDRADLPRHLREGPDLVQITLPDGTPALLDQWAAPRALRGETGSGLELVITRRDTGERWIGSYSFAPIRGADGAIVGAVVVARDITAAKEAQADLATSHAALQRLIAAQDRIQEEERARIARELHDDLQQILAAVRIDLGELADRLQATGSDAVPLVREVDGLAMRAIVSTRRMVDDLRPQIIEDLGLVPALQNLARQFARRTGIACEFEAREDLGDVLARDPELATCLFRVAQEALNNVAKHAQASRVTIRLAALASGQLALSVVDNGRGIRAADRRKPESFGMQGMAERVRHQGGSFRVEQLAQGGTLLEVLVPLQAPPAVPPPPAWHDTPFPESVPGALDAAPVPRLLGHTARQTLQAVIDAMDCNVAVIDGGGIIRFVNRGWTDFAERNGNPGSREVGPGVNYLEVCRRAARHDESAAAVLRGLVDLLAGRTTSFAFEYPCNIDTAVHWYRMHAAPMASGDVLVMHVLIDSTPAAPTPPR